MLDREPPTWRTDAKWVLGIALTLALAVLVPVFSLAQLSAEARAVPVLERILTSTLLSSGDEDLTAGVRQEFDYTPGEPLELVAGSDVTASPQELQEISADEGVERLADVLTSQILDEGAPAVLERVEGTGLEPQVTAALEGSAGELVRSTLVLQMLPAGIENGSRLANWQLQAQQNPGEEVQPVVGLFVTVPPQELQGLTPRNIGVRAVEELAEVLLVEGEAAASELVTNVNLSARFEEAVDGPIPQRLRTLFETLLLPHRPEIAQRIEQARLVTAASEEEDEQLTLGVVSQEELAGLDPEEANRLVVDRLAQRAYEGGSGELLELVSDTDRASRLAPVAGVVDALSRQARSSYLRLSWILGVVVVILALLLVVASRGWGRLANPGFALVLAAMGGAVASLGLAELSATWATAEFPLALQPLGAFADLGRLLGLVTGGVPREGIEVLVRNHLIVLGAGLLLLVLALLLRIFGALRPRRRSYI